MPSLSSALRSFLQWAYLSFVTVAGVVLVLLGLLFDTWHQNAVLAAASQSSAGQSPAAVGAYYQTGIVLISVGCSVLATGLCGLLYQLLIGHTREEKAQLQSLRNAGLQMAHDRRELTACYGQLIEACRENIDVLGWSFRRFHDSYAEAILNGVRKNPGMRIRLLVVDPDGEEAKLRMHTEEEADTYFSDCLRRLVAFAAKAPQSIEVRKLDRRARLPTMYFRIDSVAFVGPYFHAEKSNLAVTYELREPGWLFSRYSSQFELLWDKFSHPCRPAEAGHGSPVEAN